MEKLASVRVENAIVTADHEGNLIIKAASLAGARVVLQHNTIEIRPGDEFDTSPWGKGSMFKGNRLVGSPDPVDPPKPPGL